jgi:hypothetical protein
MSETWEIISNDPATWSDQSQDAANWGIQYLPDNYVAPGYWEPGYTIGPYEWTTAGL